jgi:hypothetical protein
MDGIDDTEKESGDGNALQNPLAWSLARGGFNFLIRFTTPPSHVVRGQFFLLVKTWPRVGLIYFIFL